MNAQMQAITNIEIELERLVALLHEYENVLRFYAKHDNWMSIGEAPDLPATHLIGFRDDDMNGWAPAENALAKFNRS